MFISINEIIYYITLAATSSISFGLFLWELNCGSDLKQYLIFNALTAEDQTQIFKCILVFFGIITPLVVWILTRCRTGQGREIVEIILKLFSLLVFLPLVFDKALFAVYPSISILIATFVCAGVFYIFRKTVFPGYSGLFSTSSKRPIYGALFLMVLGYSLYFSYYTIINHYNFGTSTYDLAFYQNPLINTLHGRFMVESIGPLNGANVFCDHCDFILLAYLPFFYIIPKTETLLAVQSISLALAAVPLFFLSRAMLKSSYISLMVVLLFLFYPANHCANFYDFHELSFLPLAVFLLFYCLAVKNTGGFIGAVFFMLIIKVDIFLLLILVSAFIYIEDRRDWKYALYALAGSFLYGIVYVFVLKKRLIGSYVGYFRGILPVEASGGMDILLKQAMTNPVFLLKTGLTKDNLLYVCQIFGPLAFFPLMRAKNFLLYLYGFSFALLGTWAIDHTINFQYVWYIVPFLFIGFLYVLRDMLNRDGHHKIWEIILQKNITAVLITVLLASFIYSWQYGAVLNRKDFWGGFHQINFKFTRDSQKRLDALNTLINMVPPGASVSASERLSAHFTKQGNMRRFSDLNTKVDYLLLNEGDRNGYLQFVGGLPVGYEVIARKEGFILLKKI